MREYCSISSVFETVKSITPQVIVIDANFRIVRVICILLVNSVVCSTNLCFTHYEEKKSERCALFESPTVKEGKEE